MDCRALLGDGSDPDLSGLCSNGPAHRWVEQHGGIVKTWTVRLMNSQMTVEAERVELISGTIRFLIGSRAVATFKAGDVIGFTSNS